MLFLTHPRPRLSDGESMAITRCALRVALHRLDRTFLHRFDVRDVADELLSHEALAARLPGCRGRRTGRAGRRRLGFSAPVARRPMRGGVASVHRAARGSFEEAEAGAV